jgi:hypothetical protein
MFQKSSKLESKSYGEAMRRPDASKWLEATFQEIEGHVKHGTWEIVRLPHSNQAIGCRYVFKSKRNTDGSIERYKGGVVAKGLSQKPGIDYVKTFVPTARLASPWIILAEAHKRGWKGK